jgi:hypothetical protein
MTGAPSPDLLAAFLRVVARDGWAGATAAAAAREADMALDSWLAAVGDPFDALDAFFDHVGREAMLGASGEGNVRDRLFDGVMRAADALQPNRGAVEALIAARDPGVYLMGAAAAAAATRRLAAAAGVPVQGIEGPLRVAALAALFARVFAAWRRDETADMAETMAALDKGLADAERVAEEGPLAALRTVLPAFPGLGTDPGRRDRAPE